MASCHYDHRIIAYLPNLGLSNAEICDGILTTEVLANPVGHNRMGLCVYLAVIEACDDDRLSGLGKASISMITVLEPIKYELNGARLTLEAGEFAAIPLESQYIGGINTIIGYILRPREDDWPSFPILTSQLEGWISEGRAKRSR